MVVPKQFVLVHEKVPTEKQLATSLVQPEGATAHDKVSPGKRPAPVLVHQETITSVNMAMYRCAHCASKAKGFVAYYGDHVVTKWLSQP